MRSHIDPRVGAIAMLLLLGAAMPCSGTAGVEQVAAPPAAATPTDVEIAHALGTAAADPNLAIERTIKTLRWRNASATETPTNEPGWIRWIGGLFEWIERAGRLLIWGAALVAAGLLVLYMVGIRRRGGESGFEEPFVAPAHVRDLDIRPESLPADIGAAARRLWDRGEHRLSLALLYRGLLSRLAHVYRIPIRASSTEGDCLVLATGRLAPHRQEYTARLVHVWQRSVYGHEEVQTDNVYELCDRFAAILDRSVSDARAIGGET